VQFYQISLLQLQPRLERYNIGLIDKGSLNQ